MTSRYAYPDSRGYHFCDGIRSVTKTGEMLPHAGGEVTLTVEGLASPVRAGYSSMCTHAFITTAAISQSLHECHKMKPMKYVVHCPMGVTLQARGTIRLPVVMPRGQSASVARSRAEDSPMSQSSSEGQGDEQHTPGEAGACKEGREEICGHGTVMTLSFVVVEGQTKECMLDSKTLHKLGLRPHDLAHPSHPLKDPSLEFQRACIAVQRARDPMKVMAYYPVPEGARKPVLTFGIGQDVMRTVKGVLVMLQDGGDKDEPRLMARQVLDGPGQNVVIKTEEDHPVPNETEWQDLPKVEPRSMKLLEECAKKDRRPRAPADMDTAAPAQAEAAAPNPRKPHRPVGEFVVPAWWAAVEGLLFLQEDYVAPSDHSNSGANAGPSGGGGRAAQGISGALASIGSIVTAGPATTSTLTHCLSLRQDITTTSTIIQASLRRGACGQGARAEGGATGGRKRTRVTVTVEEERVEHKKLRGKSQLADGCR